MANAYQEGRVGELVYNTKMKFCIESEPLINIDNEYVQIRFRVTGGDRFQMYLSNISTRSNEDIQAELDVNVQRWLEGLHRRGYGSGSFPPPDYYPSPMLMGSYELSYSTPKQKKNKKLLLLNN